MSDTTKTDLAAGQSSATAGTSTGPKTAEGKARSRLNALKQGRYFEAFGDLFRENLARFAPASRVEARIVQQLPHVEWSIARLQAIETAYLNRIHQDQLSPASGQPQAVDSPTRLGIALEASANSSNSCRRFTPNPEKNFSGESPSGDLQTTDSIEA